MMFSLFDGQLMFAEACPRDEIRANDLLQVPTPNSILDVLFLIRNQRHNVPRPNILNEKVGKVRISVLLPGVRCVQNFGHVCIKPIFANVKVWEFRPRNERRLFLRDDVF